MKYLVIGFLILSATVFAFMGFVSISSGAHVDTLLENVCPKSMGNTEIEEPDDCPRLVDRVHAINSANYDNFLFLIIIAAMYLVIGLVLLVKANREEKSESTDFSGITALVKGAHHDKDREE